MPMNASVPTPDWDKTWIPEVQTGTQKKRRLLVVDKPQFSAIIRKMLIRQYDIVRADDVASGLQQLKCADFDGVIVDEQVMGGGLQLVEYMHMSPTLRRVPVILTCIQPAEEWVQHIQFNDIAHLIAKPFRPSTLLAQLEVVFANDAQVSSPKVPDDIDGVAAMIDENLPRLKRVFPQVPSFSIDATDDGLFALLAQDTQVQGAVLALANSSCSPGWRQIDSAKLAVNMMGLGETAMMTLCVDVVRCLKQYYPKARFNLTSFFKHAIGTALIARAIGKKYVVDEKKCFWAGLIHDVGKIVLDGAFPSVYSGVRDAVLDGRLSYAGAEEELLGFSHSLAGGYLAKQWHLGEEVVEAVVCHHGLALARRHIKLTGAVHLADWVCSSLSFGSTGELEKPAPDDPMLQTAYWKLGLTPQAGDMLLALGKKELKYAQAVVDAVFKGLSV